MQLAYSEAFDPFKATPADLRAEAVSLRFTQSVGMLHSGTALGSCDLLSSGGSAIPWCQQILPSIHSAPMLACTYQRAEIR